MRSAEAIGGAWLDSQFCRVHNLRDTIRLRLVHDDGREEVLDTTWKRVTPDVKELLLARIPVCTCNRRRVDPKENTDGYAKCSLCRNEEMCDGCQKRPVAIRLFGTRRMCRTCATSLSACDTIAHVPIETWVHIAGEARRLSEANAFAGSNGAALAQMLLSQLSASECQGWAWYYSVDHEIWASHLSPSALEILQGIVGASEEGKVLLAAWISGGPHRGGKDYFTLTQVDHRDVPVPPINLSEPRLAVRLGTF